MVPGDALLIRFVIGFVGVLFSLLDHSFLKGFRRHGVLLCDMGNRGLKSVWVPPFPGWVGHIYMFTIYQTITALPAKTNTRDGR